MVRTMVKRKDAKDLKDPKDPKDEHDERHDHGGHEHGGRQVHGGHGHEHGAVGLGHAHAHAPANFGRAFAIGVVLNSGFVLAEVGFGLWAHSLALVADAGHNLSDVFGLLLAWGAVVWSSRPPTERHTYGWRRSSILAALANAVFLLVSIGVIAWEAVRRLTAPPVINAGVLIWVAAAGILVNGITAVLFASGRKHDLNIRAAFLHMAADTLISAGVVAAGVVILFTHWWWVDPVVSLALAIVIIVGTWGLLRDSVQLALDAVPAGISLRDVRDYLAGLPSVCNVHHIHIWGLSTSEAALTAHLVLKSGKADNALLDRINHDLNDRFGIDHATIQFEAPEGACPGHGCRSAHPH